MKNSLLALVIFASALAVWACAPAENPAATSGPAIPAVAAAPSPDENVEEVINQLERDWVAAIVKKDTATIDRLLAENFNGTSPSAHTYSREMAIEDLKSGRYVVEAMNLDEISVTAYGDTAVAFTSQEEKSKYEGKDYSGHYHYTDTWMKKNGQWQVVASHGSRFDKPHEAH